MLDLTNDPNDPFGERHCAGCGKVIPARQTTLFRDGDMFHFRCWAAWLRLEAVTEQERSQIARARAQALVTVARRLLDQVSEHLRQSSVTAESHDDIAPSQVDSGTPHDPPMAPLDPPTVPQCCWFCGAVQGVTVAPEPGEANVLRVAGCACAPVFRVEAFFWTRSALFLTPGERQTMSAALGRAAATRPLPRVELSLVTRCRPTS